MTKYYPFEVLKFRTVVAGEDESECDSDDTEAMVKIRVHGREVHEVASGDGPINAWDLALRKALNGFFPCLHKVRLVDYRVRKKKNKIRRDRRIVTHGSAVADGSESSVTVYIIFEDNDGRFKVQRTRKNSNKAGFWALVACFKKAIRRGGGC